MAPPGIRGGAWVCLPQGACRMLGSLVNEVLGLWDMAFGGRATGPASGLADFLPERLSTVVVR